MNRITLPFEKTLITFGLIFGLRESVHAAGLFIEPAITYEISESETAYPAPFSNSTGKIEGLGLGARIGLHMSEALFLGLDMRYAMPQFKDSSINYDARAVSSNMGPVIGLQMPFVGLRVWGSYILSGELNPEASENFDLKFKSGDGYRVGVGVRAVAVSLNLEYEVIKYDDVELEQNGSFAPGTSLSNTALENKAWLISLSFPIAF